MERFFDPSAEEFYEPVRVNTSVSLEVEAEAVSRGLGVFHLEGTRMMSQRDMFAEFARGLDFPDYFGMNWNALDECLADLDWLDHSGYLLIVGSSESILLNEGTEARNLLSILLSDVSREWANSDERVIFRVTFVTS